MKLLFNLESASSLALWVLTYLQEFAPALQNLCQGMMARMTWRPFSLAMDMANSNASRFVQ